MILSSVRISHVTNDTLIDTGTYFAQTSHHSLSHISFPLEIHDIPHHFAHSAWCTITPPPTYLSANPYQPPFLAWTSGRIPTKWSLSLPPGGRDCWLPHDFGCWTLLAARWWSGVDNNNNTGTWSLVQLGYHMWPMMHWLTQGIDPLFS